MFDTQYNKIFFSCHSVFTFFRMVLLSFWVTGSQLSQSVRNSCIFLTKTKTLKTLWVGKFKFCCILRIIHQHSFNQATFTSSSYWWEFNFFPILVLDHCAHLNTQWPELRQRFLNGKIAEMVFFEVVTGHCVFPATQLTRLHNGVKIFLESYSKLSWLCL